MELDKLSFADLVALKSYLWEKLQNSSLSMDEITDLTSNKSLAKYEARRDLSMKYNYCINEIEDRLSYIIFET